jgi:hypothetical protein
MCRLLMPSKFVSEGCCLFGCLSGDRKSVTKYFLRGNTHRIEIRRSEVAQRRIIRRVMVVQGVTKVRAVCLEELPNIFRRHSEGILLSSEHFGRLWNMFSIVLKRNVAIPKSVLNNFQILFSIALDKSEEIFGRIFRTVFETCSEALWNKSKNYQSVLNSLNTLQKTLRYQFGQDWHSLSKSVSNSLQKSFEHSSEEICSFLPRFIQKSLQKCLQKCIWKVSKSL